MHKGRLEAYSDAVLAIIITIMVLEMRPPHGASFDALKPLWPIFLSYVLSFVYLSIYWHNHHHMLQIAKHVDGAVLWMNSLLLFSLSLIPFVTSWMGENHFAAAPVLLYGCVLLAAAISYFLLTLALKRVNGSDSAFAKGLGSDFKGKLSIALYVAGIAVAMASPMAAGAIYALVAVIWLVPDKRFARVVHE